MYVDVTKEKLEECQNELASLTKFSHDNRYVGALIMDRILRLQQDIKTYEQLIDSVS